MVAAPLLSADLGVSKAAFGVFFTLHDLIYGFAKYVAGMLADRSNPRILLSLGLLLATFCNFGFGLASTVTVLGVLWVSKTGSFRALASRLRRAFCLTGFGRASVV